MEPPARRSVGGSSLHDVSRVSLLFRQQFPVALITIMLVIPTLLLEKAKQEVEHLGLIIQEQTRLLNRLGTWSIKAAGRFDLLSKYDIPFRYFETLETACREHDLDLDFMIALMKVESNFDPLATSTQNAYGLMQIQVPTARELDLELVSHWQLYEPVRNIFLGAAYFRNLLDRYSGDYRLASIAYNRGPTRLDRELADGSRTIDWYYKRIVASHDEE